MPRSYFIAVKARNWVTSSIMSPVINITVPYRADPTLTTISGDLTTILGAVPATVKVTAKDE